MSGKQGTPPTSEDGSANVAAAGRRWAVSLNDLSPREANAIQEGTGWLPRALRLAYKEGDLDVFDGLVGIMRARDAGDSDGPHSAAPDWSDAESPLEVANARDAENLCGRCDHAPVCRYNPEVSGAADVALVVSRCAAFREDPDHR